MAGATTANINTILHFLPACIHCRSTKRRCDTNLPACLNCSKIGAQCEFLDHPSGEVVSRKYVASLLKRLKNLQESTPSPPVGQTAPFEAPGNRLGHGKGGFVPILKVPVSVLVDPSLHEFLVGSYLENVHEVYPILDASAPCLQKHQPNVEELSPGQVFELHMVYSIACHTLPGNDTRLVLLSDTVFDVAREQLAAVTAEASLQALQAVCLLAVRSLFDPLTGNLSQQLAFAWRLLIEVRGRGINIAGPGLQDLMSVIFCISIQLEAAGRKKVVCQEPAFSNPAELTAQDICAMYIMQCRFLSGREIGRSDSTALTRIDWHSLASACHHETELLLRPCEKTALSLLLMYLRDDMIFNVFSQHWTHKAAAFLFTSSSRETQQEGLHLAMRILDRCVLKWPNAKVLQQALQTPMESR